jgi:regulator of RNase E activity RraA
MVVVPRAAEEKVLELAEEKLKGEHDTLAELRQGISLREVFARYGIL